MSLQSAIEITTAASVCPKCKRVRECYLESIIIRLEDLLEVDQLSQFRAPDNVPSLFFG